MDEISLQSSNKVRSTADWPVQSLVYLRRPRSAILDRTRDRHPSRKTCRPRTGPERPTSVGSRSAPSCFERRERGDGSSGRQRDGGPFVIELHDDYATKRKNVRKRMRVDDAEVHNNRPT